jgi:hypothetical protein
MNGPTRDTTTGTTADHELTAHHDAEDGLFWDAYWTLDDEWLPEPNVPTPLAATAPRPTTDSPPITVVSSASVARAPSAQPNAPSAQPNAPSAQPNAPQAKTVQSQTAQPKTVQPTTAEV